MRSMRYESQQFLLSFQRQVRSDQLDLLYRICEEYKDALQLLEDICDYLYQERDFYRVALKMEGQNSFQEYFSEVMDPYLKYLADQIMGAGKEEAFFLRFFGDAFLMAIIRWVMDENIMQPREFVRQLDETISLGAKKILEVKQKKSADSSVL